MRQNVGHSAGSSQYQSSVIDDEVSPTFEMPNDIYEMQINENNGSTPNIFYMQVEKPILTGEQKI